MWFLKTVKNCTYVWIELTYYFFFIKTDNNFYQHRHDFSSNEVATTLSKFRNIYLLFPDTNLQQSACNPHRGLRILASAFLCAVQKVWAEIFLPAYKLHNAHASISPTVKNPTLWVHLIPLYGQHPVCREWNTNIVKINPRILV